MLVPPDAGPLVGVIPDTIGPGIGVAVGTGVGVGVGVGETNLGGVARHWR